MYFLFLFSTVLELVGLINTVNIVETAFSNVKLLNIMNYKPTCTKQDVQCMALIHSRVVGKLHHKAVVLIKSCVTNQSYLHGPLE